MRRNLSIGLVLSAALVAACNTGGTATPAPTTPGATTPAATAAAPTAGSPTGLAGGAAVVFAPNPGGTPTVSGGATLTEVDGKTVVVIAVVSSGTEAMAAAIQAGTCANRTPEMAYRLTEVTSGASTTTLDVSLATLTSSPYVINIFVLGSETESSITCGEIKAVAAS